MSLSPVDFLSKVLPDLPPTQQAGQQPCYFALGISPDERRVQMAAVSPADIQGKASWMVSKNMNAYMALGAFADASGGRKKENALAFKCFWADVDAGKPTSKYANASEALVDLTKFVQTTGLRPSLVVSSGMGLHVYWCLDKNITADKWVPVAGYFKAACDALGLDVDPTRACDKSSVLRVPGTLHIKTGNIVTVVLDSGLVYTAKEFLSALVPFVPKNLPPQVAHSSPSRVSSAQQAMMASYGLGPEPLSDHAEPIVRNCPQVLSMGLAQEPQWYQAMTVLKRCVDGREWTHRLSAMDPARYNPANTDAKFDHAPEAMPCTCDVFASLNPVPCSKCRFRGLIKSPVQLARSRMTMEAQLVDPAPAPAPAPMAAPAYTPPVSPAPAPAPAPTPAPESPIDAAINLVAGFRPSLNLSQEHKVNRYVIQHPQFVVDYRGVVYRTVETDAMGVAKTTESMLLNAQLYYLYSIVDKGTNDTPERSHMFEFVFPNGRTERRKFSINEHYGVQQTVTWFANAKAYLTNSNLKPGILVRFMEAYLNSVAANSLELDTHKNFGWVMADDPVTKERTPAFLVGPGMITSTGLHPTAYTGPVQDLAERTFTFSGTLEAWKDVPRMYKTLDQKPAQLAICMSLAAPLMKYANGEASSAIFSLWSSESGLGKSGVLRACASIWGNPKEQFISREASMVARSRTLSSLHNLPAFMDEMTDVAEEDMYGLAYTLTGGKEKNKLRSSGDSFVETGSWSTVSFLTSNKSFKSVIAKRAGDSNATLLRVMEYECDFKSYENEPVVNQYITACLDACRKNYGHAGLEFIYQLLQHPQRMATLSSEVAYWIQSKGFSNNERFMSNSLAIALKAGRWAVEWGLLDYDMDALEAWVISVFVPHNRVNTEHWTADPLEVFTDFLMSRQQNTVIVAAEQRNQSMPDPGGRNMGDKFVKVLPMTRDCTIRYAIDERRLTVAHTDFSEWCTKRRVSPTVMLKRLQTEGVNVRTSKGCITAGIPYAPTPMVKVLILDSNALDILGYIPDISEQADETF